MIVEMDLQAWTSLDAAWRKAPDIVREELHRAMQEADQILEREVKDLTPTATGLSRASIFSQEETIDSGALGVVGTAQMHVAYVELGTRPHFPPIEPLRDWVRVKFGLPDKDTYGPALAIARRIAARGTLAVGMFHRAFARHQTSVALIFEAARNRIAARLAGDRS